MSQGRNMPQNKTIRIILPIIWLLFILFLSTQNGNASHSSSMTLARWIRDCLALPITVGEVNRIIRKCAHVIVFAIEGILVANAVRDRTHPITDAITLCTMIAVIDEGHKVFVPGRHCHINEIILDIIASAFAIIIFYIIQKKHHDRLPHTHTAGNR